MRKAPLDCGAHWDSLGVKPSYIRVNCGLVDTTGNGRSSMRVRWVFWGVGTLTVVATGFWVLTRYRDTGFPFGVGHVGSMCHVRSWGSGLSSRSTWYGGAQIRFLRGR